MKGHLYRVAIQRIEDNKNNPVDEPALTFNTRNHDHIMPIVERVRARGDFSDEDAAALAVGLKMFSEIMLTHKDHELFNPLRAPFLEFMKGLKQSTPKL